MKVERKPNSPCADQTEKSIKNWLRLNTKVGVVVAIRRMQEGMLQYQRGVVVSLRPRNFNVGIQLEDGTFAESGTTFDHAGRSWQDPSGPVRLVAPTPAVLQACDACHFGTQFLPGKPESYVVSVR
jgi:hypothetical protein